MNVSLKYHAMFFVLFFISLHCSSLYAADKAWQLGNISDDVIENAANKDSLNNIVVFFKERRITLNNNVLHVGNELCQVINKKITPMEYWMSERTISFYRDFFKKNDVILSDELNYISAANPDSECQRPFSEFIEMNGDLILFYKNRVIWYYPENDRRLVEDKYNINKEKPVESSDGVICANSSNDMDVVYQQGFIMSCFYPGIDLISAYNKSREGYKQDEALKMLKPEIKRGKNESVVIASDFTFDYRWKSTNELEIIVEQPGGTTTLIYLQKKSGTTVKSISSPD